MLFSIISTRLAEWVYMHINIYSSLLIPYILYKQYDMKCTQNQTLLNLSNLSEQEIRKFINVFKTQQTKEEEKKNL
jgi:hypothetical protein